MYREFTPKISYNARKTEVKTANFKKLNWHRYLKIQQKVGNIIKIEQTPLNYTHLEMEKGKSRNCLEM